MPRGKIQESFPEKHRLEQKLEKDWQNFLYQNPYLIYEEKHRFLEVLNQLTRFARRSIFKFRKNNYEPSIYSFDSSLKGIHKCFLLRGSNLREITKVFFQIFVIN